VVVRESLEFGATIGTDLDAAFTNAAHQSLSRSAEGSASPTGVLLPWIALPLLQDPLQWIVYDPPVEAELGYERFMGVRWRGRYVVRQIDAARGRIRFTHPVFVAGARSVPDWGGVLLGAGFASSWLVKTRTLVEHCPPISPSVSGDFALCSPARYGGQGSGPCPNRSDLFVFSGAAGQD